MSESELVAQILLRIGSRSDCRIWRAQPVVAKDRSGRVMRALPKGHPDIAGVLRLPNGLGVSIMIEAKSKTGRLSQEQIDWARMLTDFGALYVLAFAVEDVEEAIDDLKRKYG